MLRGLKNNPRPDGSSKALLLRSFCANGGGKLWQDPSARYGFIGRAGEVVSHALRSNRPVAFVSATYVGADAQIQTLHVEPAYLRFRIQRGVWHLSFVISRFEPEQEVELFEITDGEHKLATFHDRREDKVKWFSLNHRFVIVFHSRKGVVESAPRECLPEKKAAKLNCRERWDVFSGPV
jgi:hypothetical protein